MKIMVVDDEQIQMEKLKKSIAEAVPGCRADGFINPLEALAWAQQNSPEVVFLDIQMPVMDGITLAKRLKIANPRINLVFVTGFYEKYALSAVSLHFSGYLQKPVSALKVRQELDNLRYPLVPREAPGKLTVKCFGDFEIFCGGKPVSFSRSKSKEVFAYLVDRKGAAVNGGKICAVIFENNGNEASSKSNLRTCIADIKETLYKLGVDGVLFKGWDSYAINPDAIYCDYYDWEKNVPYAMNAFRGEYMSDYSWAEDTLGYLMEQKQMTTD